MSRWVLVDDTDSSISYTGPWLADVGSHDSFGNFGPPYLSTLHGVNAPGTFSYSFKGSRVLISATVQFPTVGDVTNPSWQCIVDGENIDSITYTTGNNRLRLCEKDGLDEGTHNITVRVDVSNSHTFWLDYIQYLPFPDTPLDTAALSIDRTDAGVQQGLIGTWTQKSSGYYTQLNGASFRFEFSGTSLIWVGYYDNSLPMDATTGTYSIDGQSPVSFALNGLAAQDTGVQYNQVFFNTPELEAKIHTIEVSYQGDTTKTPLSLSILEIQNGSGASAASAQVSSSASSVTSSARSTTGTVTAANSSSQNNPQTASSISTQSPRLSNIFGSPSSTTGTSSSTVPKGSSVVAGSISNKDRTPAFLGGILGGFALLLLIGILVLFLRRRRKRIPGASQNSGPRTSEIIQPFLLSPPSNQTSPPPYGALNDSSYTGSSSTRTEAPLSPVGREYHANIPTKGYENRQDNYPTTQPITSPQFANNPELSNPTALPPRFDPLLRTKHAASSSSGTELSSPYTGGGDRDQMDSLHRDVDSGLRFGASESTTLPPRYTLL